MFAVLSSRWEKGHRTGWACRSPATCNCPQPGGACAVLQVLGLNWAGLLGAGGQWGSLGLRGRLILSEEDLKQFKVGWVLAVAARCAPGSAAMLLTTPHCKAGLLLARPAAAAATPPTWLRLQVAEPGDSEALRRHLAPLLLTAEEQLTMRSIVSSIDRVVGSAVSALVHSAGGTAPFRAGAKAMFHTAAGGRNYDTWRAVGAGWGVGGSGAWACCCTGLLCPAAGAVLGLLTSEMRLLSAL